MMTHQDQVKQLFDYNPETGVCTWKVDRHKAKAGEPIDERYRYARGYISIGFRGKTQLLHRLIWLWMTGDYPQHEIDHINGVKDDNRWDNLRDVTRSEQMWNRSGWGKSEYVGVHWAERYQKWEAGINVDGEHRYLGRYDTEEKAFVAYLQAKILLHGETRYALDNIERLKRLDSM